MAFSRIDLKYPPLILLSLFPLVTPSCEQQHRSLPCRGIIKEIFLHTVITCPRKRNPFAKGFRFFFGLLLLCTISSSIPPHKKHESDNHDFPSALVQKSMSIFRSAIPLPAFTLPTLTSPVPCDKAANLYVSSTTSDSELGLHSLSGPCAQSVTLGRLLRRSPFGITGVDRSR